MKTKEYERNYYLKNREKIIARVLRRYHRLNPPIECDCKFCNKKYEKKHKNFFCSKKCKRKYFKNYHKKYHIKYYLENSEKIRATSKKYYKMKISQHHKDRENSIRQCLMQMPISLS